ncbi:MAG: RidA family protein [Candidatus Dormibacteraeota bacterium]|nr:RidA family protein [Candidatus Dormibacteraeota bacterium]
MRPEFFSPDDLPQPPGYSHVVGIPAGRLVWTSGQVALDVDGEVVGVHDWEQQTRLVLFNVGRALSAGGASWRDVVKLTFFVTDTKELAVLRSVRDEFTDPERPPTSTLVKVAGLIVPELLLEVEAVAWRP